MSLLHLVIEPKGDEQIVMCPGKENISQLVSDSSPFVEYEFSENVPLSAKTFENNFEMEFF